MFHSSIFDGSHFSIKAKIAYCQKAAQGLFASVCRTDSSFAVSNLKHASERF